MQDLETQDTREEFESKMRWQLKQRCFLILRLVSCSLASHLRGITASGPPGTAPPLRHSVAPLLRLRRARLLTCGQAQAEEVDPAARLVPETDGGAAEPRQVEDRLLSEDIADIQAMIPALQVMVQPLNRYTLYRSIDTLTSIYEPGAQERAKANFATWLNEFYNIIKK